MCAKTRERRGKEQERRRGRASSRERIRAAKEEGEERGTKICAGRRDVGGGESERGRSLLVLLAASWPRTKG